MLRSAQICGGAPAPLIPKRGAQSKKTLFTDLTEPIIFFVREDITKKEAFQVRFVDIENNKIMSVVEKLFWSRSANRWMPTHKQLWMEMGALGNLLRMANLVYAKGSAAEQQWFARRQKPQGMRGPAAALAFFTQILRTDTKIHVCFHIGNGPTFTPAAALGAAGGVQQPSGPSSSVLGKRAGEGSPEKEVALAQVEGQPAKKRGRKPKPRPTEPAAGQVCSSAPTHASGFCADDDTIGAFSQTGALGGCAKPARGLDVVDSCN
jgi:hypothetical protein